MATDQAKIEELAKRLREAEVRPPIPHGKLVQACADSACKLREASSLRGLDRCLACGSVSFAAAFGKHGFAYLQCESCWSLFATYCSNGA